MTVLWVVLLGGLMFALIVLGCYALAALKQMGRRLEGRGLNMGIFTPEKDCSTVIPVPIHASTCDHNWDILSDQVLEMAHEKKSVTILACRNCGIIDKTVQVTSPPPPPPKAVPPPPPPTCQHQWDTVVEHGLEAPHEQKVVCIMTCRVCGTVDKTVEATSQPTLTSKSECRHAWETEKKMELLSAYEQMLKSITVKENYGRTTKVDSGVKLNLDLNKAPAWMFRKTYISLRICSLCGEIDKTISSNFELNDDQLPAGHMPDMEDVEVDDSPRVGSPINVKRKKG